MTVYYFYTSRLLIIIAQVELSDPKAELRLLEVFYHKIYKVKNYTCIDVMWICYNVLWLPKKSSGNLD